MGKQRKAAARGGAQASGREQKRGEAPRFARSHLDFIRSCYPLQPEELFLTRQSFMLLLIRFCSFCIKFKFLSLSAAENIIPPRCKQYSPV